MLSAVRAAGGIAGQPRGTHHVEHARGEAEQQEYDQPPRRDVQPAVEQPADQGSDQHAADELGREPETAGESRSVGPRPRRRIGLLGPPRSDAIEPFAEPSQPRRQSSLVGGARSGILIARAHAATRASAGNSRYFSHPEAARTILAGYPPVKNSRPAFQTAGHAAESNPYLAATPHDSPRCATAAPDASFGDLGPKAGTRHAAHRRLLLLAALALGLYRPCTVHEDRAASRARNPLQAGSSRRGVRRYGRTAARQAPPGAAALSHVRAAALAREARPVVPFASQVLAVRRQSGGSIRDCRNGGGPRSRSLPACSFRRRVGARAEPRRGTHTLGHRRRRRASRGGASGRGQDGGRAATL